MTTGLAGCLGGDDGAPAPTATSSGPPEAHDPEGGQVAGNLSAEAELDAPARLSIGDWFETTSFGNWGDLSYTLVVAADLGDAWLLAADDPDVATFDAQWEWIQVGPHAKSDLASIAHGGPDRFDFFQFPLFDGKTWESRWALGAGDVPMQHQATFSPSLELGGRTFPGYVVTATTDQGTTWRYEYAPAIGYLLRLGIWDAGNAAYTGGVEVIDRGSEWSGTLYTGESELLVGAVHAVDLEPGETEVQPAPHVTFEVADGQDRLYLNLVSWANAGASQATAVDPDGGRHTVQAVAPTPDGQVEAIGGFLDPVPGRWEVVMGGLGADTGAVIAAWQTTLQELIL